MTLEELVKEACDQSPVFRKKWLYWVAQRKKVPTFEWLMENLEIALGKAYVKEAARSHIAALEEADKEKYQYSNKEDSNEIE